MGILLIGLLTWNALAQEKQEKKDTTLFYQGQELLEKKDPEAAAKKFRELLDKYPQSNIRDLTYYWLGKSYLDLNKFQVAKEVLASLRKEFPTSPLVKRLEAGLQTADKTPTAPAPPISKEAKAKKAPPPAAPPAPTKEETAQAPPLEAPAAPTPPKQETAEALKPVPPPPATPPTPSTSQPPTPPQQETAQAPPQAAPQPVPSAPPVSKEAKPKKSKEEIRREAIALYQKIIRESPNSPEATKARERLKQMGVAAPSAPSKQEIAQAPQPSPRPTAPPPQPRTAPGPSASKGFFLIITQVADLKVEGKTTKVSVYPGDTALVPFTITNSGNAEDSFSLETTLSPDFQAVFFADTNGNGQIGTGEKQISATPPLAIGQAFPVLLRIRLPRTISDGQKKEFEIRVASNYDPNIAQLLKQVVLSSGPRLVPEFHVDKQRVRPGDRVQYSLNLTNVGSAEARDIKLQYFYHPTLIFLSANPIPDRIEQATRNLTWNIKTLPSQSTVKAEVNFKVGDEVLAGQQIINRGSLESALASEPILFTSAGVLVEQVGGVKVEGSREEVPTTPGDTLFLPFSVKNQGNGPDSFSLRLESELSGMELFLDQNGDGLYQSQEPHVTEVPKLGSLETAHLLLKVQVPVKKGDGQRTELTVSAASKFDPNVSAKESKFLIYSLPIVNLSTQLASSNSIPGSVISYQIIAFNSGTGIAKDLVISDLLPTELDYVNADPAPAEQPDRQLTWTLSELGPNQKKVFVVSVRARPGLRAGTVIQKEPRIRYRDLNGNSYE